MLEDFKCGGNCSQTISNWCVIYMLPLYIHLYIYAVEG